VQVALVATLGALLSKDAVDFADEPGAAVPIADVVVLGLNTLLPLITPESLQVRSGRHTRARADRVAPV
jgi:hypothetical protein